MRFISSKTIGIAVLIGILFLAYLVQREKAHPFQTLPETIGNFEAIDVDGGKTNFNALKGKATLIVLSASWCPACVAELPTLQKLHQEFSKDGLNILMVNEDDNVKIASRFIISLLVLSVRRIGSPIVNASFRSFALFFSYSGKAISRSKISQLSSSRSRKYMLALWSF